MADEQTETEAHANGTNGASTSWSAQAEARAAFLAGDDPMPKADESTSRDDDDDDDSDLDDDEIAKSASSDEGDEDEDPDADLDEDDDEEEDEDEEKPDADTAKRLSQVQRTEKRMREQLKKERASMEAEVEAKAREHQSRINAEIEKWKPRVEAAERFEKLAARANVDPIAVLNALGVDKDRYEYVGRLLYNMSKADSDPKARAEVAALMKSSEIDAELADLKKWREDREKADTESKRTAEADRELDAFFGKIANATTEKTPLSKAFIKANPAEARERMQIIAFRLAQETGTLPNERAVIVALEKDRRKALRDLGIDPKTKSAIAASGNVDTDSKTTTSKKSDKKPEKTSAKADDKKLSPRDAFIRGEKFD